MIIYQHSKVEADDALQTAMLQTREQAVALLANAASFGTRFRLEVHEDKCFDEDQWLGWGTVELFPSPGAEPEDEQELRCQAVANGSWLWTTPTESELEESLSQSLPGLKEKTASVVHDLTETMQDIARRLGLLFPTFAPDAMKDWPYQRPATWVMDTSAIRQGAADFARLFLFPMVRLRVPSIAGIEILNWCDSFFSKRRTNLSTAGRKANCLKDHIAGQGTQRVLLRLEWQSDIEIERSGIGGDPLRFVFQNDNDQEFKDLNLSRVQRSMADRLIIETAKEHRSRLSAGQSLYMVTSDQGMARTALGEGMSPVFFEARRSPQVLQRRLGGTVYHPFLPQLHCVSLVDLLWETATCFGAARLVVEAHEDVFVEAVALSEDVIWSPDHTKENLFFCRWNFPAVEKQVASDNDLKLPEDLSVVEQVENKESSKVAPQTSIKACIFTLEKLLLFITKLAQKQSLTNEQASKILNIKPVSLGEYRRFLQSPGFLVVEDGKFVSTDSLNQLSMAIQEKEMGLMHELLDRIPSYHAFLQFVESEGRQSDWRKSYPFSKSSAPNYRDLAEICGQVLTIPNRGICRTPNVPSSQEFTRIAVERYQALATQDLVETGRWLEELAWNEGIHPVVARAKLEEAYKEGLLRRFYEGSTPDTSLDDHVLHVLESEKGVPVVKKYYLYRGDFLWSERASVRLKIEATGA